MSGRKSLTSTVPPVVVPPPSVSPGAVTASTNQLQRTAPSPVASHGLQQQQVSVPASQAPSTSSQLTSGHQKSQQPPKPPSSSSDPGMDYINSFAEQMKNVLAAEMLKTVGVPTSSSAATAAAAALTQLMGGNDGGLQAMMAMGLNPAAMAALMPGFGSFNMAMSGVKMPPTSSSGGETSLKRRRCVS